ncbi:TPA: AAA family ATPase [Klebsiella quasipneumoniae subsp. similipneumoniae]|nr:AAA family ATPase [Klebsiella quasipneumoniae subsp. similipneumoniae]
MLYGRNYSGKTTLSRIFRALETVRILHNYMDPNFTIRGDKGDVAQASLAGRKYRPAVYNIDSIKRDIDSVKNLGKVRTSS